MSQVIDIDDGYYNIKNLLDGIGAEGVGVDVGIFDDPYIAMYATFGEVGTETEPARPAFRTAMDVNEPENTRLLGEAIGQAIDAARAKSPYADALRQALEALGVKVQQDVRWSILSGQWVPNAPFTVAKKGFNYPLYETGAEVEAVGYRVQMPYWGVVGVVEGRQKPVGGA